MIEARYLIGIDLGTTNTVVAYADLEQGIENAVPQIFPVDQLVASGTVAAKNQLPSFRYHPAADEISESELRLPWFAMPIRGDIDPHIIGTWGRDLGAKVDGRLVSSAKSWLCHSGVDRTAAILPWGSEGVDKISPLVASSSYLAHVKSAWNCAHPEYPMELQDVVITIPASFDEVARSLTLKAAEMAGYMNVHLIEEPQAACYDWYARNQNQAKDLLQDIHLVLVCDVGGGTTDLSLIKVSEQQGALKLDRVAVGDHLMLGGDNIDLALAHIAEQQLGNRRLSAGALSQLIQQCRQVKETLLAEPAPDSAKATILGAGAKLIGGAKSVEFSQTQVRELAVDGFLPITPWGEGATTHSRAAVVEFGLPYASDPAISHHICDFLIHHQASAQHAFPETESGPWLPDGILFNGGFFNSGLLRNRARDLLSEWRGNSVKILQNQHPDLAVAYGAVAYGLARRGAFLKIGGGAPRSYFLKVESPDSDALQGVCLLPKGTEEDTEIRLADKQFLLTVGQPVSFQLYTNSGDEGYQPGQLVGLADAEFKELPPSHVKISSSGTKELEVELACQLSEVGTLGLDCVATENPQQRWQVEFDLRRSVQSQVSDNMETLVELPENFAKAEQQVRQYYGGKAKANLNVRNLRGELDSILGKRDHWDIATLRALFDVFWDSSKRRRRSQHHERVWFNIAGFCLRPGLGAAGDPFRIESVWDLYEQGLQYPKETRAWAEWWTFWRRIAGGLNQAQQSRIFADIADLIDPGNSRNSKVRSLLKTRSYDDMVRLAGALEKLPTSDKTTAGNWLAERLTKASESPTSWWALGRIGARETCYAGLDAVLPVTTVRPWLDLLLQQDWIEQPQAALACVMIARRTNDRSRDIDEALRNQILARLENSKTPATWQQMVTEYIALESQDSQQILGDALPAGIKIGNL